MRFVTRNYRIKPKILRSTVVKNDALTIAQTGNKDLIRTSYYADPYDTEEGGRSRVIDVLDTWYYGKCAYCEDVCKGEVEHYRPKKAVKDLDNTLVPGHNGYYWLCYEWSNLLPSCANCNRNGGKHNKFPVLGIHKFVPLLNVHGRPIKNNFKSYKSYLLSERPVLLHPEIDNPISFFEFDIDIRNEEIAIKGIDVDNRGRDTIKICKLNRKELITSRHRNVVAQFATSINSAIGARRRGVIPTDARLIDRINNILQTLHEDSRPEESTHTLLRKYVVANISNFRKIISPYIESSSRLVVETAFQNYTPY